MLVCLASAIIIIRLSFSSGILDLLWHSRQCPDEVSQTFVQLAEGTPSVM